MLRKEQNELLTQTGPGTAMGQLFRCYWLPALLAEELPDNDCPPVRVKLLPAPPRPPAVHAYSVSAVRAVARFTPLASAAA